MQEFTTVFARRPYIDERFMHPDVVHDFLPEGANGEIRPAGRISLSGIVWTFLGQWPPFIDPLLSPTVHNTTVAVTVQLENPEGIACPSVVPVTVKYNFMLVSNALATNEFGERLLIDIVAHHLVLQFAMPVHLDGTRDMPDVVQEHVLVRLH